MKIIKALLFLFCAVSFAQYGSDAPWMIELRQRKSASEITYQDIKDAGLAYWSTRDETKRGSGFKPFMRWIDRMDQYVKRDGTVQSGREIYNIIESRNVAKGVNADNSNWLPVGPFNYIDTGSWSAGQGRTNVSIVDPNNPNTYYIGAPAGGIWKSTDAGATWTPLTDFLGQIGVSAIAIDPQDSNVIYIGTGDDDGGDSDGLGMFKSTDGGQTFLPTGLQFNGNGENISEIYLDPTNNQKLFIAAGDGIYISTDGGATVTNTLPNGNIRDLKLKPGDSNTVYISSSNFFYTSNDGGLTWNRNNNGYPATARRSVLAVSAANPAYVYALCINASANLVGLYRSTDSGASFTRRDIGTDILENTQGFYDLAMEVSQTNADIVYTGCLNVWRSSNGGATFSKINAWNNDTQARYTHADIHQIREFNGDMFVMSDGGVYRSTDDGATFQDLTATAQISQFYRIAVSKTSSDELAGGLQDNGGFSRSTGQWKNYYGADGMDAVIDPNNPDIRYGFTQFGGGLYRTVNGGNSRISTVGAPESGNWITPLEIDSQGTVYAGYSSLYKLTGNSFTQVNAFPFGTLIDEMEIDPADDDTIYIATNAQLRRSDNAGVTFTVVNTLPNNITAIEVNNDDSNIVYAATRGSFGRVYKSVDKGVTFTDITGNLPNLGKNALAHLGGSINNEVFVGTTVGVYRYDETLNMWESYFNNLPNVNVRDIEINTADNKITAATYGRGIWQSALSSTAPADELGIVANTTSNSLFNCGGSDLSFTVENGGTNSISQFDVDYSVDGAAPVTTTINTTVPPLSQAQAVIPNINLSIGTHTVQVTVNLPNDTFANNNTQVFNVVHNVGGVISDVHGFETRDFLVENGLWERGVPSGTILNQAATGTQAYATNLNGDYSNDTTSYLYTGCYDLTNANSPSFSFDMAFDYETDWDLIYVEYSTDGSTWNILGTSNDPNWYNSSRLPDGNDCFNCVGAQWTGRNSTMTNYSYDLQAFTNESNMSFRFVTITDQSVTEEGAVIDNVVVDQTLSTDTAILSSSYSIYPNPTTGLFNINWDDAATFTYSIYDVSGKLIKTGSNEISGSKTAVDITGATAGMYFITLQSNGNQITEKLLIR